MCAAALSVRAAMAKAFGISPDALVGLQPTWVTEPDSGKVIMNLDDSKFLPFPKEATAHVAMLDYVQCELQRLAGSKLRLVTNDALPGGRCAVIGNVLVECAASDVAETLGQVNITGRASADSKKKPDSMVLLAGKKKQAMVKFSVATGDEVALLETEAVEDASALIEASEKALKIVESQQNGEQAAHDITSSTPEEETVAEEQEMVVDPFQVVGKIDYDKLVAQFGSQVLTPSLIDRLRAATVDPSKHMHRFIRRGIFFSHRDLDKICACVEAGVPFYLYTGRGPSSAAMHLGHLVPFMLTQWLQEAFGVPLVIQMTDDEKFLWKGQYDEERRDFNLDHYRRLTRENAKDIIACGFDKERTFIFSDCDYIGHMYPNILKIWKSVTYSQARASFGFEPQSNIGQSAFPAVQAAPSFATSFTSPLANLPCDLAHAACLIPCAIDQDPYFRITRDVAHKLAPKTHKLQGKPALIHSKFFPPLQGAAGKMSSSDENSAIFLTDSPEDIERKIKTHAFSGGRETAKQQRELGADLDADVSYQWLRFFLEDDQELERIGRDYGVGSGEYWNTSSVKAKLIVVLQEIVAKHQARRNLITESEVDEWMQVRPLAGPVPRTATQTPSS